MRRSTAGWLVVLGLASCSCGQPGVIDAGGEPVVPQAPSPGEAVAVAPPQPVAPPEPSPAPRPRGPIANAAAERGHARAQAGLLRGAERLPPLQLVPDPLAIRTTPKIGLSDTPSPEGPVVGPAAGVDAPPAEPSMPGYFVGITDPPDGPALAHFHAALHTLAEGRDPDGKVRVAMYGASGTAADLAVGYVRTYLQTRFGDGGPGFVPLVPLSRWYRHNELHVEASTGWVKEHAQIRSGRLDGHYGLLGASFTATQAKRWAKAGPKKGSESAQGLAHVELMFLRQPEGGSFRVRVDDGPTAVVSTDADDFGPGYHTIEVEPGPHTVRVETTSKREVRVFGVVLERAEPGVVVDVLGIDGTRGSNHLQWDEALWADNLARRAPDLYTLSYGTNESVDEELSIPLYGEDLREQLRRFRKVLPEASCLLIGPVDFPIREGDELSPRPLLRGIIEAQRQIAAEEGCGYWDGVAFMGGELSMGAWVHTEPPLARRDHLHFTARGAARKGMALSDALMQAFDAASITDESRAER